MSKTPSAMKLHLRYRLYIAEMNFDINVLRIFEDYIHELQAKRDETDVRKGVEYFKQKFEALRKEIDELRHEMHILKMKLAAFAREKKNFDNKAYKEDDNKGIKKRYKTYRKDFEKNKDEFRHFENKWLN
jgi:predicted RNase H-like nuclease (RuvC/YqgF family)